MPNNECVDDADNEDDWMTYYSEDSEDSVVECVDDDWSSHCEEEDDAKCWMLPESNEYDSDIPTEEEQECIIEEGVEAVREMLEENALDFKNPDFDEIVHSCVVGYFCGLFENIAGYADMHALEWCIHVMEEEVLQRVHAEIAPPRSYHVSFIRKQPNIPKVTARIEALRATYQPEQRTAEWYAYRHNLITASNAYKAFGSQATQNQLIYEKCEPFDPMNRGAQFVSTNSTLHWGQKYEPLSAAIYEHRNKTTLSDFGCIRHCKYPFLGASPDGINTDESSLLYGRMVEIKNIVNREITGIPKEEYWVQMQLQMEVCNLPECDFVETRFKEYETEAAFWEDSPANEPDSIHKRQDGCREKGIILWFYKLGGGAPIYEYMPLNITNKDEFEVWEEAAFERHAGEMWGRNIYWYLDTYSCVLVLRNKLWFEKAVPILEDVWRTIEREKVEGYEHRAPAKRNKPTTYIMGNPLKIPVISQEMLNSLRISQEEQNERKEEQVREHAKKEENNELEKLSFDTLDLNLDALSMFQKDA
jgi:putative phage-type endonuclease